MRRGTIRVGERAYAFRLFGQSGRYDRQSNRLWVDLNQDGQGDAESNSPEVFRVTEERVELAGCAYGFSVDPLGRSLTLRPLEGALPERPSLRPATIAPKFSVSDIDGHGLSLRQYRGRVVLLDFWGTWCAPGRAEAPILRELQSTYGPSGLAIIGVAMDEAVAVRTYIAQAGHTWPQIVESDQGTLHRLYRVYGYPTKMLIGRDGKVVTSHVGGLVGDRAVFEQPSPRRFVRGHDGSLSVGITLIQASAIASAPMDCQLNAVSCDTISRRGQRLGRRHDAGSNADAAAACLHIAGRDRAVRQRGSKIGSK